MDPALISLVEQIQRAHEQRRPLRIRGGGTKDFYGERTQGELLDLRPFNGIVSYEPSELVITVRAGTRLSEVEAALAEHHQYLPFEPPRFGSSGTVGGMVAAGLSGPARASVGALRDYVLGIQIINGQGQVLTFGGQVMKNVAGYDFSRLMAGAMGTLGVITQVSLKVMPLPPAECTLLFELSETSARQQLNRWGAQPLPLNASCWLDGELAVRLRGAQAAIEAARRTMGGDVLGQDRAVGRWSALRDQTQRFFHLRPGAVLWRVSVRDTATPLNLGATLIEWHGALRWVHLPQLSAARVQAAAERAGGYATMFRGGDGRFPAFARLTPPLAQLHARLKRALDPAGILNPGRMSREF